MSDAVYKHAIDATLKFAMQHPVATTVIVVTAIIVKGACYIAEKCNSKDSNEDRKIENNNGRIRANI